MIDSIIRNNKKEFDNELLEYTIQIKALNYLKKKNAIENELFKRVKCAIIQNHTLEIKGTFNYNEDG